MSVSVRSYLSPTLVLLAFVGPARRREPASSVSRSRARRPSGRRTGERARPISWLPNRLTFDGPAADTQGDAPTDQAPIQKFISSSEKPRH